MAVTFDGRSLGEPRQALSTLAPAGITNDRSNYDVGGDGRVLFGARTGRGVGSGDNQRPGDDSPVSVVINWFTELERLAPTGR